MSAAAYGDGLLSEVQEESLDELLRSLREIKTDYRPSTGISTIDSILNVFLDPALPRQRSQYHPHSYDQDAPLPPPQAANYKQPPAVIEITGATPCSGKTQLLYLIIATTILPSQFHGSPVGGKGQAVVLLDLSNTFSILRLQDIMHNLVLTHLQPSSAPQTRAALSPLITSSLLHLHIFHPSSTPSLISTLSSLEPYLLPSPGSTPTHFSAAHALGLIALSNLSSFLWQDRLDADDAALLLLRSSGGIPSSGLLHDRYRTLTHQLAHLQRLTSCLVIATTSSPSAPATGQPPSLRPHLPHPWPGFATCKIIVQRQAVPRFEPGTSVEEAEGERGRRWDVVKEGRFAGSLNWWGSEEGGWRDEWREGVRRLRGGGRFGFVVAEKGVQVLGEDGSV